LQFYNLLINVNLLKYCVCLFYAFAGEYYQQLINKFLMKLMLLTITLIVIIIYCQEPALKINLNPPEESTKDTIGNMIIITARCSA
jgi:hypothetical protein